MTEVVTAPGLAQPDVDRSTGLIIFGIIQLILGATCIALVLGATAGWELAARRGLVLPQQAFASVLLVYGGAALYFISAGIGSLRRKRWARALCVVVSAMWLVGAVIGGISAALLDRRATSLFIPWLVLGVALPLAILLFYRRDDVRATCVRYDRKGRWTDRVPLPVLAVVLLMGFGSTALLVNVANPVIPMFGTALTGPMAAITMMTLAILFGFLTLQIYRLKESAWWTVVLLQIAGCLIAASHIIRGDSSQTPAAWAIAIATWIGYLAYLFFIRRYFVGGRPRTRSDDPAPARAV
jgi:hypothetical protein